MDGHAIIAEMQEIVAPIMAAKKNVYCALEFKVRNDDCKPYFSIYVMAANATVWSRNVEFIGQLPRALSDLREFAASYADHDARECARISSVLGYDITGQTQYQAAA